MSNNLIRRLELATEGSIELDEAVADALGGEGALGATNSLDIALALVERVLPGCSWRVQKDFGGFIVAVRNGIHEVEVEADTPALALCTALLRAHREGEGRS